jgi:GNAT superfamily N-acetyltransferase
MDLMISPAETETDVRDCWPVYRQLHAEFDMPGKFVERLRQVRARGYVLLAGRAAGRCVVVAGYRLQGNFTHGDFMYVDDLVCDEAERGKGYGARMLAHLREEARRNGCARLLLDSPVDNLLAHRFYWREGMMATAARFTLVL